MARRARVMLARPEGLDNKVVAKKLRCSTGMVGKWRSRFLAARLEGLYDAPRAGAPRKITDDQVEQVVIQTLESTAARGNALVHARVDRCICVPSKDTPRLQESHILIGHIYPRSLRHSC